MKSLFRKRVRKTETVAETPNNVALAVPGRSHHAKKLERVLNTSLNDINSGRYRLKLYRFLTEQIPVVSACLDTLVRLSAAPGSYTVDKDNKMAKEVLDNLSQRLYRGPGSHGGGMTTFLVRLFTALYRDGLFGGIAALNKSGDGIGSFIPFDNELLRFDKRRGVYLETDTVSYPLTTPDCYYLTYLADERQPLGRSIFQSIPFVAYIEQQLVEDMRRASHNSGYHKLHVKITPPERLGGESDNSYVERMNGYFDSTVGMIRDIEIDENPVTWDNIEIKAVGPENVRAVTNSWFMNHRAMIEEICSGTNLAPFLLGYSFGATTTWASFKFDLVMRQVRSVQLEAAAFLNWMGNIELALAGIDATCEFVFDNNFAYQAGEASLVREREINSILKLYEAGLLDESVAREKAGGLI